MKSLPKVWRLIIINIIFQFVACSSRIVFNENDPQNPFKNVVQRKFQEVDSFNFKSPAKPEQYSQNYNIILKPRLLKGEEILLAVTYGSQSETWTLSKDDKFTSIGKLKHGLKNTLIFSKKFWLIPNRLIILFFFL